MKIEVQNRPISKTESTCLEGNSQQDVELWIAEQEKNNRRFIVFPTLQAMLRWRSLVLGI
jgi:hypothetical protein